MARMSLYLLSKTHKVTKTIIGIGASGAALCGILWGWNSTLASRSGQTEAIRYQRLDRAEMALLGLKLASVGTGAAILFKLVLPPRPIRRKCSSRNRGR
jgi:hypothetical protein